MKETGLMFKAPLVRAILSGQKTQTRRILNPQPAENHPHDGGTKWVMERGRHTPVGSVGHLSLQDKMGRNCPMGKPGDRIYVRETWNPDPPCDGTWGYTQWAGCRQGQIEGVPERFRSPEHCNFEASWQGSPMVWTPSIHMPKWAARIWLEVTSVRVERLQDISEADASREGLQYSTERMGHWCGNCKDWQMTARQAFRDLWVSTGGDWAANPWVWVIYFKRIEHTQAQKGCTT